MAKVIELNNVSKHFGKKKVLSNINLSVDSGTCIGIVGSNGSGKSVLFKLISGIEKVSSGTVMVNQRIVGKDVDFPESIGILIDEPGFIDVYSGFDNLKFLASIQNYISDEIIVEKMHDLGLMDMDLKVKHYSMGMKKKLGIVQAIMEDQRILLLDEPFNALDYKTVFEVKHVIQTLKKSQKTIVLTGHNHSDLEELCDVIYFLDQGQLTLFDETLKKQYFKPFET